MPINIGDKLVPTNRSKIAVESLYIYDSVTKQMQSDINNYVLGEGEGTLQDKLNKASSVILGAYSDGAFIDSTGETCTLNTNKIYIDVYSGTSYYFNGTILKPELGSESSIWNEV